MSRPQIRGRGREVGARHRPVSSSSSYFESENATRPLISGRLKYERIDGCLVVRWTSLIVSTTALAIVTASAPGWAVGLAVLGWLATLIACYPDSSRR